MQHIGHVNHRWGVDAIVQIYYRSLHDSTKAVCLFFVIVAVITGTAASNATSQSNHIFLGFIR